MGTIYGQEMNPTTFNLCRMNMINARCALPAVRHQERGHAGAPAARRMMLPSRPSWPIRPSARTGNPAHQSTDDRFSAPGKLAPRPKADFAFLLHMLHHLETGAPGLRAAHGVLFRGAAEAHPRIPDRDLNVLDAVIGLPAQIFYGTGIPTCIVVLKKGRRTDDVLFIDASQHYEKVKRRTSCGRRMWTAS